MTEACKLNELFDDSGDEATFAKRELIIHLGDQIESIERSIGRLLQSHAVGCGLTMIEGKALATLLEHNGSARLSVIADHVRIPLSTMTGVATRLEKSGLVERERAADDKRAFVLNITPAGRDKLRELFVPFFGEISDVIDSFGADTMQSVVAAFDVVASMAAALENRVQESSAR